MNKITEYFNKTKELLDTVLESQISSIEKASEAIANTLINNGMVYSFGTGHSHLLAEEIFYRAGGLVKVYPILDEPLMLHTSASSSSMRERLPGYAQLLLDDLDIKKGDTLLIFSNSGRNAVPVDMAMLARKKGMKVICITNIKHSSSVTSRHPSGLKLYEVCDIVIDNCGEIGDACVKVDDILCGPTSTAIGSAILQSIVCGVVEELKNQGINPEVWRSSNIDGGNAVNDKYINKYRKDIRML